MSRHLWTIANVAMIVVFAFSVIVQFNDPDPLGWAGLYGAALAVCAFELRRRVPPLAPGVIAVIALAWAATIGPRVIGKARFMSMFAEFEMANIGIEESREFYGLLLIALWMAVVAVVAWRRRVAVTK